MVKDWKTERMRETVRRKDRQGEKQTMIDGEETSLGYRCNRWKGGRQMPADASEKVLCPL